ncbi:MAG: VCBS repeat-containing protein, partial [Candidatus Dormibacteria bacterium]
MHAPEPGSGMYWGLRIRSAGDLDGDGINDLWISGGRHVYAVSGRSRSVMFRISAPDASAQRFGTAIANIGDVNGDGVPDVAIGADGRVWVFSGADGSLIQEIPDPSPPTDGRTSAFGTRLSTAGDLDGDGVSELLVGDPSAAPADAVGAGQGREEGCIHIFHGVTGELLRTIPLPDPGPDGPDAGDEDSTGGRFGMTVQVIGDLDSDGIPEQLVGAPHFNRRRGRLYILSGRDGSVLRRIDSPLPEEDSFFGFADASPYAPGDLDGDGIAEIYAAAFDATGPAGEKQGRAWVISGATGRVLYELANPHPVRGGQFGWSLATSDAEPDASPRLYVGNAPHHLTPPFDQRGESNLFDGRDGCVIESMPLPQPFDAQMGAAGSWGPNLGWSIA